MANKVFIDKKSCKTHDNAASSSKSITFSKVFQGAGWILCPPPYVPPPNWQNINLYKIHTCSVNCIKKLKIISKSFTLKGFTRSGSLFASALARAVSCSGGLLAAFPFLWAVPVWERESEREREVQRKALTLSAQTQTWRLPPPTTSDESVAKK